MKRLTGLVAALILVGTGLVAAGPVAVASSSGVPHAGNGKVVKRHLRSAIRHLRVHADHKRGYERSKYTLWTDANHDCQDTRAEVLVAESLVKARGGCTIRRGKWRSYYDGKVTRVAHDFDIDHLVPLAENWRSGGWRWGWARRTAYANDLRDPRTLIAVSAHANRSKSDADPSQWMPARHKCRYVRQWVGVKTRWRLNVNPAERRFLLRRARHCSNKVIRVHRAVVVNASQGGGGGCEPGYSPCLPVVDDLDCSEIPDSKKPVKVTGSDPYNLDSDGDGWGCTS